MEIEQGLRNFLLSDQALATVVGERIFPITYPQEASLPAITYQLVSKVSEYSHDGGSGAKEAHYQISCFGKTYGEAKALAKTLRDALEPLGAAPGSLGGIDVGGVFLENEIDVFDPADAEELSAFHVLADYTILAQEG